jgi:hypothetical protein
MTVNARLPKTPHRQARLAGASGLMLDSLDKKTPWEEREGLRPIAAETHGQMANNDLSFKAPGD